MSDVTPILVTQDQGQPGDDNLLLDNSMNMVIAQSMRMQVFEGMTNNISVANQGTRHQFIRNGKSSVRTNYKSGTELDGDPAKGGGNLRAFNPDDPSKIGATAPNIERKEYFIELDNTIVTEHYIPNDDQMIAQFDITPNMVAEMADAQGRESDIRALYNFIEAGTTAAEAGIHLGGTTLIQTGGGIDFAGIQTAFPVSLAGANALIAQLEGANEQFELKNIHGLDKHCVLSPYLIKVLNQAGEREWSRDYQDKSDWANRVIGTVAGFKVHSSNILQGIGNTGIVDRSAVDFRVAAANTKYQKVYNNDTTNINVAGVFWEGTEMWKFNNRPMQLVTDDVKTADSKFYSVLQRAGYGTSRFENFGVLKVTA